MAFPAVMKAAAMMRTMAVMCFMTDLLFEVSYAGPLRLRDIYSSGACCYARRYCMPMAKQRRTPVPQSQTRICNDIQPQRRIVMFQTPATPSSSGIRTDTREDPFGSRHG